MKRFFFITSVLFLSVTSVVLFGSSSANAESAYPPFNATDELNLFNAQCESQNISLNWSSFIRDSTTISESIIQDFDSTIQSENGVWGVTQTTWASYSTVEVYWLNNSTQIPEVSFNTDWGGERYNFTFNNQIINYNAISLTLDSACNPTASFLGSNYRFILSESNLSSFTTSLFFYTGSYSVPPELTDVIPDLPDSFEPPLINDSTPDFFVVSSINGLVTIRDRRFNTFDNVPFVCEDGLTPYIRYTLQDLDHYLIFDTGGFSPTVDYQFQLPVKNQIINYEFSGRYDCGDNTEPSFSNSSSVQFQLDPLGGLKTDLFEQCISQEFPFLHYQGCYENVMRMLNMLSFSSLKINGWTYNAQCRQLTVLGGWLGTQSGEVICPNFSPQVRNTVTPFVAFFLGLTMFGFVVRMRGNT